MLLDSQSSKVQLSASEVDVQNSTQKAASPQEENEAGPNVTPTPQKKPSGKLQKLSNILGI